MTKVILGFDIGGSKCAVSLARYDGEAPTWLGRLEFPTAENPEPGPCIERLCSLAEQLLATHAVQPEAIGISCGGPLDSTQGLVLDPPNLPSWKRVEITNVLGQRFGCPAKLENDANLGALAEWRWGAGRGCDSLVFITMGTGLGAGLILNGRLWRGASDLAGEVGHLRLAEDGPEGYGKRGSFEGFCSGGGIARGARAAGLPVSDTAALFARAATGDLAATAHIEQVGMRLGQGLALLIDILNPECVVIGGIFVRQESWLRPALERALEREALPGCRAACRIVPAALGERIGDYAAIAAALESPR